MKLINRCLILLMISFSLTAFAADIPEPKLLEVDKSISEQQAKMLIDTAKSFYAFWNTGKEEYAKQSVSTHFIDHTLPKGRPQGPEGPIFASKNFRKAIPDLSCEIEEMLVVEDKVVVRLLFKGTHKGEFMGKAPTNNPVEFIAMDVIKITDGKVTDNWHLEDNLTIMQQLGVVKGL